MLLVAVSLDPLLVRQFITLPDYYPVLFLQLLEPLLLFFDPLQRFILLLIQARELLLLLVLHLLHERVQVPLHYLRVKVRFFFELRGHHVKLVNHLLSEAVVNGVYWVLVRRLRVGSEGFV